MPRFSLALIALAACSGGTGATQGPPASGAPVRLERVVDGLQSPVHLTAPAGDSRLFVVEQPGRIRIVEDGRLLPTPFLDITRPGEERRRARAAQRRLPPRLRAQRLPLRRLHRRPGDTRVERYPVSADPTGPTPRSRDAGPHGRPAVREPQRRAASPSAPTGKLYVGIGRRRQRRRPAGQRAEPRRPPREPSCASTSTPATRTPSRATTRSRPRRRRGRDLGVRAAQPVALLLRPRRGPALHRRRGPERVGGGRRRPRRRAAGVNYGWNTMEGTHCYGSGACARAGMQLPVAEYSHSEGCSVTGGYVYRGRAAPSRCAAATSTATTARAGSAPSPAPPTAPPARSASPSTTSAPILSFGEDAAGELYLLSSNGTVYRVME